MLEKYLPVGTVVKLKEGEKRLMIIGFYIRKKDEEKFYDYAAVTYPEGIVDPNKILLFNHSDIDEIFYLGYSDMEETKFKERLKEEVEKLEKERS